jgi:hypothetical protein
VPQEQAAELADVVGDEVEVETVPQLGHLDRLGPVVQADDLADGKYVDTPEVEIGVGDSNP